MGRILARSVGNRRLKSSSQLNGDDLTRCDHLIARVAWYAGVQGEMSPATLTMKQNSETCRRSGECDLRNLT